MVIATCATVIASQAVISGAFSMTSQAVKLGFLPRLPIDYTSETHAGQIYVPFVNWALLILVVALVIGFGSSTHLAAAYGIAVATSMAITTLGVLLVARMRWDWPLWRVVLVFLPLMAVDWVFLVSNAAKIPHGGWFPLAFGACLFLVFTTWKRGRSIVNHELEKTGIALQPFLKSLSLYPPARVEGTAVFMSQETGFVPHALLHNLKHNRVMHERVVFLTAIARNVPHVDAGRHGGGHRPRRGVLAGGGSARLPGHLRRGRDLRGAGAAPRPRTRRSTSARSSCRARTSSRAPGRACGAGGSGCSAGCCATRSPRRTSSGFRRTA